MARPVEVVRHRQQEVLGQLRRDLGVDQDDVARDLVLLGGADELARDARLGCLARAREVGADLHRPGCRAVEQVEPPALGVPVRERLLVARVHHAAGALELVLHPVDEVLVRRRAGQAGAEVHHSLEVVADLPGRRQGAHRGGGLRASGRRRHRPEQPPPGQDRRESRTTLDELAARNGARVPLLAHIKECRWAERAPRRPIGCS